MAVANNYGGSFIEFVNEKELLMKTMHEEMLLS